MLQGENTIVIVEDGSGIVTRKCVGHSGLFIA